MAIIYANTAGNWANTSIWYTGSNPYNNIPQSGDHVYLNGKTLQVDYSSSLITIQSLRGTSAAISGSTGTTNTIVGGSLIISGSIEIDARGDGTQGIGPAASGLFPTQSSFLQFFPPVPSATNPSIVIVRGNQQTTSSAVFMSVSNMSDYSTVIREGTTLGGNGPLVHGISGGTKILTYVITGSLVGGSNAAASALGTTGGTSFIYISGSITGSTGAGVGLANAGITNVIGGVKAGTLEGISNSSANTVTIVGTISASVTSPGVGLTSTTAILYHNGDLYNTGSYNAIFVYKYQPTSTNNLIINTTTGFKTFTAQSPTYPAVSDVRNGVLYNNSTQQGTLVLPPTSSVLTGSYYGSGSAPNTEFQGSVTLPSASNVIQGITYGASNSINGLFSYPGTGSVLQGTIYGFTGSGAGDPLYLIGTSANTSSIAQAIVNELSSSTNPIAVRIQNVATVDSTGTQISTYII
jgi:hypothetical protein